MEVSSFQGCPYRGVPITLLTRILYLRLYVVYLMHEYNNYYITQNVFISECLCKQCGGVENVM